MTVTAIADMKETIIWLRQQLAEKNKKIIDHVEIQNALRQQLSVANSKFDSINEDLSAMEDQLSDHIKRDVMLRDALQQLHDNIAEYARINHLGGFDNQDMRMARKALADTADLDGLILCEKEPVAWQSYHSRAMPELSVEFDEPELVMSFNDDVVWKKPLYRAWEPK
jgi:predicted nuclease with TOPRIM domain